MSKIYGYLRVSTLSQNIARQLDALKNYEKDNNIKFECIFEDKISGKNFERPQYKIMKQVVRPGDVIVIKELDRLGRNYDEIKKELQYFKDKKIKIVILDLPILQGISDELLYTVLQDMIISIMGYVAQKEREKIQRRVKEGLKNAKANGVKLGRPKATLPKDFEKYYKKVLKKEITKNDMAKILGISRMTLYRYIKMFDSTWS
ncbi:recombinase family protein [Clostridium novyi]|uniref:recombinase family protein n=1 Tax=Clostridium novyi TaxID=1542 RepID=UPI0004D62EEA|nr:recombinase family protein [Clostridium novyi]KEH88868.1 putative resolvase [Clostridium novyi A str. GD211209]